MNKTDYLQKEKEIECQIDELIALKNETMSKYIDENKEFEIGQKVVLTGQNGSERLAFVNRIYVNFSGDIEYVFFKTKKDGTASKIRLYNFWNDTIKPFI